MKKVTSIVCPGCNNPIFSKEADEVILCPACGTLHARNGKVTVIEYEVGAYKPADGEKLYLPFWKLGADFKILREQVDGGWLSKLAGFLGRNSNSGHLDLMMPAYDADPYKYKDIAERLTFHPPAYTPGRFEPGVRREPCANTADMTDDMADFMFVTVEAEKPGAMQYFEYDLKVTSRKLVYLPYYRKNNNMEPGY